MKYRCKRSCQVRGLGVVDAGEVVEIDEERMKDPYLAQHFEAAESAGASTGVRAGGEDKTDAGGEAKATKKAKAAPKVVNADELPFMK